MSRTTMAGMGVGMPQDNIEELRKAKAALRRHMIQKLKAVPAEQLASDAARIRQRVLDLPAVNTAKSIFCFISMAGEVETHVLIGRLLQMGKTVAVPLIPRGGAPGLMEAHRITALSDCAPGVLGILAPKSPCPLPADPDLCLTPGLAFTEHGDRLGRGAGYYDRFLAARPAMMSVALALEEQIVEHIPMGPSDRRVRAIVTPSRVIWPQGGQT